MKDAQQITGQSSFMCTRDPDARTTIHQQETMTQHLQAVADHGRRQHPTTTDLRDLIRQFFPPHHLGPRVVNKCTLFFKTMSGMVRTSSQLRPSTDCDPEGRQKCDVLRTMRDVWESMAAHSPDHGSTASRDEAEQSHSACVHREATGRNRTPLLSAQTREHDDAGHAAAEPLPGMFDVQYNLRTQPGRVRCSTCRPGELRGCRCKHGSH